MGHIRVDTHGIGLCLQNITNPKKVARHSIDQKNGMDGMQNNVLSDTSKTI